MATTSPLQGVPLPQDTDPDRVPYDLGQAVGALEKLVVQFYASAAARDSKLAPPSRGMVAYLNDTNTWTAYDGSTWRTMLVADATAGTVTLSPVATSDPALILKGVTGQTGDLQEWQDATGAVKARVDNVGGVHTDLLSGEAGPLTAKARSTAEAALVVSGLSGQAADLQEWQSAPGTTVARVSQTGDAYFHQGVFGDTSAGALANLSSTAINSAEVPFAVRGASGQFVDLTQWQSNAGATVARVMDDGTIETSKQVRLLDAGFDAGSVAGTGILYMHSGALKYRGPGGTTTTIAAS